MAINKNPREKVQAHWRHLALAVSAITIGCDGDKDTGSDTQDRDTGYSVVDPLPPPCTFETGDVTVAVAVDNDGNWVLTLASLDYNMYFRDDPVAESGTILSSTVESDGRLTIVVAPESALIDVNMSCMYGEAVLLKVSVQENAGQVTATIAG